MSKLLILISLITTVHVVWSEETCAVDQRNLKLQEESPGYIIIERKDFETADQCIDSCCSLRAKGESCNAASFFLKEGDTVYTCLNIKCEPFSQCYWVPGNGAQSAKIAIFNSTDHPDVNFDSDVNEDNLGGDLSEGSGEAAEEAEELAEEEEEEEAIEALYENNGEDGEWNVDYSETTGAFDDLFHEKKSTAKPKFDESGNIGDEPLVPVHPNTHGNSGIYGPNEVYDVDYTATPIIIVGAVATVLLMLVMLICVGRKLSANERLKYRPLMDTYPVKSTDTYHDID